MNESTEQGSVTLEGKRLIDAWLQTKEALDRAKSNVNSCECAFSNAENALAKWLKPNDAQHGEKIAIWYGDSLVQVEVGDPGNTSQSLRADRISVRTRGRHGLR